MSGFVESIGFHPGWLWSTLLAALQFIGGLMIIAGFLTRPAALANAVMLAVTLWFHISHPYGDLLLSSQGMAALAAQQAMFTPDGLRNLAADGGRHSCIRCNSRPRGFQRSGPWRPCVWPHSAAARFRSIEIC